MWSARCWIGILSPQTVALSAVPTVVHTVAGSFLGVVPVSSVLGVVSALPIQNPLVLASGVADAIPVSSSFGSAGAVSGPVYANAGSDYY
jgi:hypothetical protein